MKKRKLKRGPVFVIILFIIGIIIATNIIKTINYHKTYEYKLMQLGYSIEETKQLEKLNNNNLDYILSNEYNKNIIKLINEKYFKEDNFIKYLNYENENNYSITNIIALINTNANYEWYTETKKSDITKNNLILINKFNYLDSTYNDENMQEISNKYSYGENQKLLKEAYDAFINMFYEAKKENLTLIINSSYRSFKEQEEIYNDYKTNRGEDYADTIAARPGFSEHQTGLAIDIQTYGSTANTFENFDEFIWLQKNAYKYGFILRYPKDKEFITGYAYESWHYRYVGIEIATYIYENDITYDEYYSFYLS